MTYTKKLTTFIKKPDVIFSKKKMINIYIYTIDNIEEAPARLVSPSLKIRNLSWFKYMKEFYLANNTYNEWVYDDMLKDWRETFYAD